MHRHGCHVCFTCLPAFFLECCSLADLLLCCFNVLLTGCSAFIFTLSVFLMCCSLASLVLLPPYPHSAEGPVYAAWFQETPVAVKCTHSLSEVEMHLSAGWHDNVVGLRGLTQHGGNNYLIMELCPR